MPQQGHSKYQRDRQEAQEVVAGCQSHRYSGQQSCSRARRSPLWRRKDQNQSGMDGEATEKNSVSSGKEESRLNVEGKHIRELAITLGSEGEKRRLTATME